MSGVWLELDVREADALDAAADYLSGFGRVLELLDRDRYPGSDVLQVIRTLRELHSRAIATARAA
jgi:hypothetical protein